MKSIFKAMLPLLLLSAGFFPFTLCAFRQYVFVNESKTWIEAQSYCRDKYTDLVTLENEHETIQLLNAVSDSDSTDLAWIGLYDDLNSWKWTLEGSDFFGPGEKEFRNWYILQPAYYGLQNPCVFMNNGIWFLTDCQNTLTFICYDGRQNATANYVWVYELKNWTEAQRYCRENHTDLLSIRNETENQIIQHLLQNYYYGDAWIGLYRSRSWSDQSNSTFSNWRTGQPDNAGLSQYCTAVSFSDSGQWTDENCNDLFPFICYNVSSLGSRQYHFISENKSWTEAQRYCRVNYTDLATLDNTQEMNNLMNTVNGSYSGSAWIGLYDDLNSWRWSLEDNDFYQAGEREFRNWYHQPDNFRGNDLCVVMYNGKWFDLLCDHILSFVCYDGGQNATQRFILITERRNWTEALRYCRENHTDLANVRNLTENQMIDNIANGPVWIGLYRNRIWSNGQVSNYQNWRSEITHTAQQPDNGYYDYDQWGDQRCTAVSFRHSGRWTDEHCLTKMPFFCYSRTCTQSSCGPREYHFISENKSWSEAQRYCRVNYTDLATVDNMEEMYSLVRGLYYGSAWIGLYDDMNSWRWSLENTELRGGFQSWNVQQPRNQNGGSLCVYMSYRRRVWREENCSIPLPFICYDGQNTSANYVSYTVSKNWTEAQRYCREHHTDLLSIRNETENQMIQHLLQNYYYGDAWIGLYRSRSWSDQSNSTFSNWRTGQPDNAGLSQYCTAVSFSDSGQWTDENCNDPFPFICYNMSSLGPRQYHFINESKSWSEAQRYCRVNYTDLATLDNTQEMNSLMNTVNGSYSGSAWIGLYDDLNSWRWSLEDNDFYQAGEREFRNWEHQPDNFRGNELCVVMSIDGSWFDALCDENNWTFVCYDGRANVSQRYVLVEQRINWSEAQRYCRQFHTDLASVRNETEHQHILSVMNDLYAWIGLYRNRLWSDQSNSSFTYWQPDTQYSAGQPDNGFNVAGLMGAQHCTALSLQSFGQWTDESCFERLPFFCYHDQYVVGLKLQITSTEILSESQIREFVLIQIQEEFKRHGLSSNFTMSLRSFRKTGP